MQMSIGLNCAIRIIVELSKNRKLSSKELAVILNIPETYILKIMKRLKKTGFIISAQGIDGGFILNKNPKEITIYDIFEVMEASTKINRCLEDDQYCSRCAIETCHVRKIYSQIQKEIEGELKKYSIYELLKEDQKAQKRKEFNYEK